MNDALRDLAKRLAKASPERFGPARPGAIIDRQTDIIHDPSDGRWGLSGLYAFWGPLWEALPSCIFQPFGEPTKQATSLIEMATQVVEFYEAEASQQCGGTQTVNPHEVEKSEEKNG